MPKRLLTAIAVALMATMALPAGAANADGDSDERPQPKLVGRAVLPVATYAPGPPANGPNTPPRTVNGIPFPTPSQPVEGFSAVIAGRDDGEYLAMPDNGFGAKANSTDFLIRAYYIRPEFKTAHDGSGRVTVDKNHPISFGDPDHRIGFPIVNEATTDRLLTGGDIDPESLQRGANGDLWVGDEFGPWVLHFDATGKLLDPPFATPDGLMSPNNPHLGTATATQPNSRGFEAMAISPNGKFLYPALEGATVADAAGPTPTRRYVFEFSVVDNDFTGRSWLYQTEQPAYMIADMTALNRHELVVIERDAGLGVNALFRRAYVVDLDGTDANGALVKTEVVDLAAIPDPKLISLPPIHRGDVGLGDPYRVTCESIEAIHHLGGNRLLFGCDNNFPNMGRNPGLADDNEFIVVKVPGLRGA